MTMMKGMRYISNSEALASRESGRWDPIIVKIGETGFFGMDWWIGRTEEMRELPRERDR